MEYNVSMPSGMITMREVPTRTPIPRVEIRRRWDLVRVRVRGSIPELKEAAAMAIPKRMRVGRPSAMVVLEDGYKYLLIDPRYILRNKFVLEQVEIESHQVSAARALISVKHPSADETRDFNPCVSWHCLTLLAHQPATFFPLAEWVSAQFTRFLAHNKHQHFLIIKTQRHEQKNYPLPAAEARSGGGEGEGGWGEDW